MPRTALSWRGFVYYGEIVGFLFAWAAGIVVLTRETPAPAPEPAPSQVAVAEIDAP